MPPRRSTPLFLAGVLAAIALGATDAVLFIEQFTGRNAAVAALGSALAILGIMAFVFWLRRR